MFFSNKYTFPLFLILSKSSYKLASIIETNTTFAIFLIIFKITLINIFSSFEYSFSVLHALIKLTLIWSPISLNQYSRTMILSIKDTAFIVTIFYSLSIGSLWRNLRRYFWTIADLIMAFSINFMSFLSGKYNVALIVWFLIVVKSTFIKITWFICVSSLSVFLTIWKLAFVNISVFKF